MCQEFYDICRSEGLFRITALIYFLIIISFFIVATQLYSDFLPKFTERFQNIELTKIAILIFSLCALIAVTYMFISRIYGSQGLNNKAWIVFRYLVTLQAINIRKEDFNEIREIIESYLNDNHWILAVFWVESIIRKYSDRFLEEARQQ